VVISAVLNAAAAVAFCVQQATAFQLFTLVRDPVFNFRSIGERAAPAPVRDS
jgi:hypothetical protein